MEKNEKNAKIQKEQNEQKINKNSTCAPAISTSYLLRFEMHAGGKGFTFSRLNYVGSGGISSLLSISKDSFSHLYI